MSGSKPLIVRPSGVVERLGPTGEAGAVSKPARGLLVAEGGYAPLNPPAWIANLRLQVVLLSVAPGDRQGLPSSETLEAVKGYTLLRTDRNGWIELTTDGEGMWVEVERRWEDLYGGSMLRHHTCKIVVGRPVFLVPGDVFVAK